MGKDSVKINGQLVTGEALHLLMKATEADGEECCALQMLRGCDPIVPPDTPVQTCKPQNGTAAPGPAAAAAPAAAPRERQPPPLTPALLDLHPCGAGLAFVAEVSEEKGGELPAFTHVEKALAAAAPEASEARREDADADADATEEREEDEEEVGATVPDEVDENGMPGPLLDVGLTDLNSTSPSVRAAETLRAVKVRDPIDTLDTERPGTAAYRGRASDVSGAVYEEEKLKELFKQLDTNGNGWLDLKELKAYYGKIEQFGTAADDNFVESVARQVCHAVTYSFTVLVSESESRQATHPLCVPHANTTHHRT